MPRSSPTPMGIVSPLEIVWQYKTCGFLPYFLEKSIWNKSALREYSSGWSGKNVEYGYKGRTPAVGIYSRDIFEHLVYLSVVYDVSWNTVLFFNAFDLIFGIARIRRIWPAWQIGQRPIRMPVVRSIISAMVS